MGKEEKKPTAIKAKTSYASTVISISLVLFMLGLLGIILVNAKQISDHVKENIGFSLYLHEEPSKRELEHIKSILEEKEYTARLNYTDKEEAAEIMKKDLGEDFVDFLGYNPLNASFDLYLKADYAEKSKIESIEKELKKMPHFKEVIYQKDLLTVVNSNIKKIGLVLLGFSILLLIVVVALINNTIRLAIYSKRFLIKTMQLVGATGGFIRRPFVARGIFNGLISGVIAIVLLLFVLYSLSKNLPDYFELQNFNVYLLLFSSVIGLGILISWISTSLAVRKFLRTQSGDLH